MVDKTSGVEDPWVPEADPESRAIQIPKVQYDLEDSLGEVEEIDRSGIKMGHANLDDKNQSRQLSNQFEYFLFRLD